MRVLGILFTLAVVLFWFLMNGLLIERVIQYGKLDEYRRGVIDFLGDQVRRERQMGIYRNKKRIGQTRFAMERIYEHDEMGYKIEFSTRVDIDLLGMGGRLILEGTAALDSLMVPRNLKGEIGLGGIQLLLEGFRQGEEFRLLLKSNQQVVFQHRTPLQELILSDGMAPILPVAGLESGEIYRVMAFDPIFRENEMVEMRVLEKDERFVDGIKVDCYKVEMQYRGMTILSRITADGEVISQEIPSILVKLVREPYREEEGR